MAFEKIGLDAVFRDAGFNAGIAAYQKGIGMATTATDKGASAMSAIGRVASGALVAGIGAATVAFGAFVAASKIGLDTALQWGASLDKLSDMFGMSGQEASRWASFFEHFGVPIEEAGQQLNFLTRGLAETVKISKDGKATLTPFGESLKKLGISATDSKGKVKDLNTIMPQMIAAFNKLPAGIEKSNLAMELFGARGGSKVLDALSANAAEVERLNKQTQEFGLELTTEQVNAIEEYGFALNDLQKGFKGVWLQIGMAVLPVARKFIDMIIKNIPRIVTLAKQLGAAFTTIVRAFSTGNWNPVLDIIDRVFGRETGNKFANLILAIKGLVKAFQESGLSGAIDEFGRLMSRAFAGFDLEKFLGDISGKLIGVLQAAWAKIQPELAKWGGQFWNWLTGKGGAISQAGAQLEKVGTAIETWVRNNAPRFALVFEEWKTVFWNWLTDSKSGVIAKIAESMGALTENVRKWSELPETQERFQNIGKTIAEAIIDGMKGLFTQRDEGEDLLNVLARNLQNAYWALLDTFRNIGRNLAIGVIRGIVENFTSPERATEIAHAIFDVMEKAVNFAIEWGNIFVVMRRLATEMWNAFTAQFRNLASTFDFLSGKSITPTPVPAGGGGGGGGSTGGDRHSGGPILQSGRYNLLAGEYVIPAPNISDSRVNNFNFSHTWNSPVSTSTQQMTESMVRRVTQQEIREVMRKI